MTKRKTIFEFSGDPAYRGANQAPADIYVSLAFLEQYVCEQGRPGLDHLVGLLGYAQHRAYEAYLSMQEQGKVREPKTITQDKCEAPPQGDATCPTCGYYCLGNGGFGCIDKPSLT